MDETLDLSKTIINPDQTLILPEDAQDVKDSQTVPFQFDIKSCEPIVCVEFFNNNLLYIKYNDTWTIKDVTHILIYYCYIVN